MRGLLGRLLLTKMEADQRQIQARSSVQAAAEAAIVPHVMVRDVYIGCWQVRQSAWNRHVRHAGRLVLETVRFAAEAEKNRMYGCSRSFPEACS